MTSKICLIIVHGFMNAAIRNYGYDQWSLKINVHSYIYEHQSCMINDHRYRYEHWSSMIIDHEHNYSWSMIVAMECCWSYMISVDQWVISWPLSTAHHQHQLTCSYAHIWSSAKLLCISISIKILRYHIKEPKLDLENGFGETFVHFVHCAGFSWWIGHNSQPDVLCIPKTAKTRLKFCW